MGGLAIMAAALCGYLAAHVKTVFTERGLLAMLAIGGAALVGFVDDWIKVRRQRSLGLNKRAKAVGQLVVAVGFAVGCVYWLKVDTHLSFTRFDSLHIGLSQIGWVVWAVLIMLGATNAVNLTDGLDGLAAGSSTFAFAAFTVIGFYQLRHFNIYRNPASLDEAVIAAAMLGACAGFLWWNAAPARIFMGDTGALGIGAALAALALLENVDLLLPIIGGLFVVETLSVIIQVVSFRLFHRRVFRMAPIHHHFELLGLAGDHGDRPLLDPRRPVHRGCPRLLLRRLPGPGRRRVTEQALDRRMRRDRPSGRPGTCGTRASEVIVVDDRPPTGGRGRAPAAGARLVEAPTLTELADLVAASALVVPSPGVPARPPGLPGRRPTPASRSAARSSWPGGGWRRRRTGAATGPGWWPSPAPTARPRSPPWWPPCSRPRVGGRSRPATSACRCSTPSASRPTCVVAEVSSFQLQFTESFRPDVSCWLNLAEDHLDWHPTMAHYAAAKARIWAAQRAGDVAVVNADDPAVMAAADHPDHGVPAGVSRRTFSIAGPADFSVDRRAGVLAGPGGAPLVAIGALRRALPHDLANALAAAAACALAVGATAEGCRQALERFETLPHRVAAGRRGWRGALVRRLQGDHAGIGAGRGGRVRLGRAHRRRPQQGPRPRRPGRDGAAGPGRGRHRRGGR